MEKHDVSISDLIAAETKKRLEVMSKPEYQFPRRITAGDWGIMAVAFIFSLLLIILCMTGVIE